MDGITSSTTDATSRNASRVAPARADLRIAGTGWVLRQMAALAAGLSRAAINRRVVGQLSRMSDRELKDIGLVRQDVRDSEMLLLEGDASSFLLGRREERRNARRPAR